MGECEWKRELSNGSQLQWLRCDQEEEDMRERRLCMGLHSYPSKA
jgi:hypothetical protein